MRTNRTSLIKYTNTLHDENRIIKDKRKKFLFFNSALTKRFFKFKSTHFPILKHILGLVKSEAY